MNSLESHLIDALQALLEQETKFYGPIQPYMGHDVDSSTESASTAIQKNVTESFSPAAKTKDSWQFTEQYRCKLAQWAFQLSDFYQCSRGVAAISMNYFDRFLARRPHWIHREQSVRVLAVTTLYLATKLFKAEALIAPSCFVTLSRGTMTRQDLEEMELKILATLNWHLHPTMPEDFLHLYTQTSFVPPEIVDYAVFILDNVVLDFYFVHHPSSVIAMAALQQALERFNAALKVDLLHGVISMDPVALMECRQRMQDLMETNTMERDRIQSPVSVVVADGTTLAACNEDKMSSK